MLAGEVYLGLRWPFKGCPAGKITGGEQAVDRIRQKKGRFKALCISGG